MRVKRKDSGTNVEVFGIYWIGGKTYFCGLSKGYDGLLVHDSQEVEIMEASLLGDYVYVRDGVFYKPMVDEGLIDDLLEGDSEAFSRFLEILKSERVMLGIWDFIYGVQP
ncbi:hypothetical protein [Achromobacter xylosoxidans]|uniref:hypothetical protein n=1 Tax=Alcaligenes xylosoxydans xylosoxydans TaxID=85698 RepID=UPI0009E7805C|nr:hypothetical protein [Achromobacter xylosoxidans]